jgi:4-hydroxybenzoate polyprenyltransferase
MKKLLIVLEMIKFEHTVFALPFALLGAVLAARGLPGWDKLFWIVVAMFSARSAAMAFNRLVDQDYDRMNPRTSQRHLPQKIVSPHFVTVFVIGNAILFVLAAWMLNQLAFFLSPVALAVILFYSYTKRFTAFSHVALGLALAIAPLGGWIAVQGALGESIFYIAAAVLLWVGGFDIIYACQDFQFDREAGLFSLPSRIGISNALLLSRCFHVAMVLLLAKAFREFELGPLSWTGLVMVGITLIYEHAIVKPDDFSRADVAFFTANGFISIALFVFVGLDLWLLG